MIYNETSGMQGDVSERGGYFSAAAMIGRNNDDINYTMDSSNAGGGTPSSEPGVRGNNPYRRPRRGINSGDVIRSDYEMEQMIAEMAAKEAMEKRIREGGCSLPRQRCLVENVSVCSMLTSFAKSICCCYVTHTFRCLLFLSCTSATLCNPQQWFLWEGS